MRYHVLACDYDGTLASGGRIHESTVAALVRARQSGRKLIMVTGRELDQLQQVCPRLDLFERVVAENGALLYHPATREEKRLTEPPPEKFVAALRERGVSNLSTGRVIVATWEPHEITVLETIRDLGLELQVIFNKGAVMVLPSGVNKASGLKTALMEIGLSAHNTVGIGDAENDHAFLNVCECSVAVANALPITREYVDWTTAGDHGAGVEELIERLLHNDLRDLDTALERHEILLGARENDEPVRLRPYGENVMIAGTSGGGKSTLAQGVLERLAAAGYQFCIIDPEGDYSALEDSVVLGDGKLPPTPETVLDVLNEPGANAVLNMIGVALDHRPEFFASFFAKLQEMRNRTGRPHWVVIDEAHHLYPAARNTAPLPGGIQGLLLLTVHPDHVASPVLKMIDAVIAIGEQPERTLAVFARALGEPPPATQKFRLQPGEAVLWRRGSEDVPFWLRSTPPQAERRRHHRKYMEGELGPDVSFYFTGPENKLNLRAHNLEIFLQLAEGVDDATWEHHLRRGDYSRWLGETLKDAALAEAIAGIEKDESVSAGESRALVREKIDERYTAPE